MKFEYAKCKSMSEARAVLFGADTNAAGHSESHLGLQGLKSQIRTPQFVRLASNESPSLPRNLQIGEKLFDDGDLLIRGTSNREQIDEVKRKFQSIWRSGQVPICLGGDHLVKHAALEELQATFPQTLVLYIDAHPDLVLSDVYNYATVIHQALLRDPSWVESIFLTGMRQINESEARGLKHWKPHIIWAQDFHVRSIREILANFTRLNQRFSKIYISVDLDGLDPSCAPAVEAPSPGGPLLAHILELIHQLADAFEIVGLDISEFIPDLDTTRLTSLTSAQIVMEVYSCLRPTTLT